MNIRTTKTAVKKACARIYAAPYAEVSHLLPTRDACAHVSGGYGWECNIFDLAALVGMHCEVAVTTGYQPFGRDIPLELCKRFDARAEALDSMSQNSPEFREELRGLRCEFLAALLGLDENNDIGH